MPRLEKRLSGLMTAAVVRRRGAFDDRLTIWEWVREAKNNPPSAEHFIFASASRRVFLRIVSLNVSAAMDISDADAEHS